MDANGCKVSSGPRKSLAAKVLQAQYVSMKKTLIYTNRYLKDPAKREAMLQFSALDSCSLEGARGLTVQRSIARSRRRRSAPKGITPSS